MRKWLYLFIVTFLCTWAIEGYSQLNRKAIKKNNRRISHYRGRKTHFGKEKIYNALGFSLNALNYYGDLAPRPSRFSTDISFTRPAIGLSFSHRFGPRYTLTGSFMYGTLRGADAESADKNDTENGIFRYNRNLSFRNRIKELSVVGTLDLFENMATYISRVKWTPYVYLGVAVFHHNPQAQVPAGWTDGSGTTTFSNDGQWVSLQAIGTEGQHADLDEGDANFGIKPYKRIQLAIPFGLGVRFRLNEVMDLSGELGFRYTFTDYLDDVSKNYVDLDEFSDPLSRALSYRSNEVVAAPNYTYTGRNGGTYTVQQGYGHENPGASVDPFNKRGDPGDKDIYMVTTIRLTYILGKTFHRAKFR